MQKPPLLLRIATIYFLLIGICYAIALLSSQRFSLPEMAITMLCALPVFVQKTWLHKVFGIPAAGAGLWIFFAMVSDFIDYISGKAISNPWVYFSIGFLLAFSLMFFSGTLIYCGFRNNEIAETT